MCHRMVRERLYDAACFITSYSDIGWLGQYAEIYGKTTAIETFGLDVVDRYVQQKREPCLVNPHLYFGGTAMQLQGGEGGSGIA